MKEVIVVAAVAFAALIGANAVVAARDYIQRSEAEAYADRLERNVGFIQ